MSRMLEALKNLSSRHSPSLGPPAVPEDDAPHGDPPHNDAAEVAAAADDPVLPPVEQARSKQNLLIKHLSAAAPPLGTAAGDLAGGMTVPMASLESPAQEPAQLPPMGLLVNDDQEEENVRESVVVCLSEPADQSAGEEESISIVSIGAVSRLLASLEEIDEGRQEEVALSFASDDARNEPIAEAADRGARAGEHASEIGGQKSEVGGQSVEVGGQISESGDINAAGIAADLAPAFSPTPRLSPSPPLAPSHSPASSPSKAVEAEPDVATGSPLNHLADARALLTFPPEADETPLAPPPVVLPPRTIRRGKTRLEQRVFDNLSHPSRSLPYRELADRLQQDLRLLTGRCLLFAGIGPASHADDVLPHLASLLAEEDAEVLLVDADATRAGLTVGFGALKETGLGELSERGGRCEELVLPTLLSSVALLPAGRKPLPDTIGVVDQVAQLLAQLEERYSLVLIDAGAHTSALVPALARLCDATYFVVRLGATDARAASTAVQTFRANGARILGCVATSSAISK